MLPQGSGIHNGFTQWLSPQGLAVLWSVSDFICRRKEEEKQWYSWFCLSLRKQRCLSTSPVEFSYFSANWPPWFCWAGGVPRKVFTQLFNIQNQRGAAEEKDSGGECWLDSQQVVTNALLKVIWSHNWSALGPDLLIPSFEIFLLIPLINFFY